MATDLITKPSGKPSFVGKPVGLAARKAEARAVAGIEEPIVINPAECKDRIGIVFDDSGSMAGESIKDAHAGIEEFLRSCKKDETSVCVYPMNAAKLDLSSNLPALALLVQGIGATGDTSVVESAKKMLRAENLTRGIIFSDGVSFDRHYRASLYEIALEKKIPIDTVFISDGPDARAEELLRDIAKKTGGIFLKFERGKSNFRTAFKYLSPGFRAMLADKSFVAKVESGQV